MTRQIRGRREAKRNGTVPSMARCGMSEGWSCLFAPWLRTLDLTFLLVFNFVCNFMPHSGCWIFPEQRANKLKSRQKFISLKSIHLPFHFSAQQIVQFACQLSQWGTKLFWDINAKQFPLEEQVIWFLGSTSVAHRAKIAPAALRECLLILLLKTRNA